MSDHPKGPNLNYKDSQMTLVSKNFLFDGMTLPTTLFLRLKENSYLQIATKGDKPQLSSLKGYKNENFQVYIATKEKHLLIEFISTITSRTIDNPAVGIDKKTEFVHALVEDTFDGLEKSNFASLDRIQAVGTLLVKLSKQIPNIDKAIEIMGQQNESQARHAMTTCMISLMIAEEAGILSNLTQDKLAAGALLHDVGLRYVPQEILNQPRENWNLEDLSLYEQHPIRGAEMLRRVEGMSVEVLLIISEHHENAIGTGFPKRIRDVKMNPLSKIVALSDCITDLILADKGQTYTSDQAIQYIENVLGQPFNKGLFSNLKNIINSNLLSEKIKK
jgi:putative nucleotidyltransferase with HDIG domain